jgi:hypothetical protein
MAVVTSVTSINVFVNFTTVRLRARGERSLYRSALSQIQVGVIRSREVISPWVPARVMKLRKALAAYTDQGDKLQVPFFQGLLAESEAQGDAAGALIRIGEALASHARQENTGATLSCALAAAPVSAPKRNLTSRSRSGS